MDIRRQGLTGAAAYRSIEAVGADPEQFMKMATDAARTFLLQAETAISDGNQATKVKALTSATKIVTSAASLKRSRVHIFTRSRAAT